MASKMMRSQKSSRGWASSRRGISTTTLRLQNRTPSTRGARIHSRAFRPVRPPPPPPGSHTRHRRPRYPRTSTSVALSRIAAQRARRRPLPREEFGHVQLPPALYNSTGTTSCRVWSRHGMSSGCQFAECVLLPALTGRLCG